MEGKVNLEVPKILFNCKYRKYVKKVLCQIGKNLSLTILLWVTGKKELQFLVNKLLVGIGNANSYEWVTWQYLTKLHVNLPSEIATEILGIYATNILQRYLKLQTAFINVLLTTARLRKTYAHQQGINWVSIVHSFTRVQKKRWWRSLKTGCGVIFRLHC